MTASKVNVDSIKPGKLLEFAHFLTRFQNHYSTPNDHAGDFDEGECHQEASSTILIKIADLEAVTAYRTTLSKRETLKDRYYVAKECSKTKCPAQPIFILQAQQLKNEIENVNSEISSASRHVMRIHRLLQRFEIWTTKILAQKDLVVPCETFLEDSSKKTKYSHFAAHLNIPCSDHFCEILPEISNNEWSRAKLPSAMHHMPEATCTLALTPNKHTWEEFAKISRMLSLLDETARTEIYKRSSCIVDIKNKHSYSNVYYQQFEFQPLDLMALWVRARRNSQAMRQLWLLFEVERRDSQSVIGIEGDGTETQKSKDKLRVHYKGNPPNARQRIGEITPWADRLVEWAVTNQTLYSHHNVRAQIQSAFLKRKRKRQQEEEEKSKRQGKRRRIEGASKGQDLVQLRQACLIFILRWFGRRHRKLTSVLFSKKQNILHLDIGCRKGDRNGANILHALVDAGIQDYLMKPEISGVVAFAKDRTLARIDRRIRNYGGQITLMSQIETLLDALGSAGKSHGVRPELIQAAKSDFRSMYNHYFEEPEDALETAALLLDIENVLDNASGESITSISNLLNGAPKPWKQHCAHCTQEGVEKNQLRTCVCCESPFHELCTTWKKESISDIISSYQPLRKLCAVQLPPPETLPDFRDDSGIKWTEMEVLVERQLDDFGGLDMPLGLSVSRTQSCYESFEKLTTGTVLDLAQMIAADKSNQRPSFPMALKVNGSLIYDVLDSDCAGARAGLQKGDVIQHMEILELFNHATISSSSSERSFDFQTISALECRTAFEIPATKLKVRILRPSVDIVQSSRDWYEQVKARNKAGTAAMNDVYTEGICDTIWHCGNCQIRTQDQHPLPSLKQEAEFCRAVIRRIGMESYAAPFEAESTEGNGTDPAVSLRRLDAMMTDIIDRQHLARKQEGLPVRAFSNPPWGVDRGSHLAWASGLEEKPMELLCNGFCALFKPVQGSQNGESRNIPDATAMLRHFLVSFISWCVLPFRENERTNGPPSLFLKMQSPYVIPSCCMCTGRPVATSGSNVCNHHACSTLARSDYFQMDEFGNDEVTVITNSLREYELRSSLVGTTFLVHHDDPLVSAVSKFVPIEHNRRPVEFMIASYLPKEFRQMVLSGNELWEGDNCAGDVGIFHLLPVITSQQLNYLLDRLNTREKPQEVDSPDDVSWASLEALNLAGVARYSFAELQRKLNESARIRSGIEFAIIRKCMQSSETRENGKEVVREPSTFELCNFKASQLEPLNVVAYDNCLSAAATHILLQGTSRAPTASTVLDDGSFSTHRSNWPIVHREGIERETELFGQTLPLPQMGSLSCSPERKYDVLPFGDGYDLVYSDLHYENEEHRADLINKLQPKVLERPADFKLSSRSSANFISKTILLANLNPSDESVYKGIGWGFELVRWEHEEAFIRVGRICSQSPAQRAGLQTNDVIVSVGGRKINSFDQQVNLISTILGVSDVSVRIEDSLIDPEIDQQGIISIVLGNIAEFSERCKLEPVVLVVYRPSQEPVDGVQEISQSCQLDCSHSAGNFDGGDDDEVMVLGTTSHSNHTETLVQPTSREISPDSRATQDPPSGLGLRATSTTASAIAPVTQNSLADSRLALMSLFSRLHTYEGHRPVIRIDHLYFPANNGVIFTMAETALFLACFMRKQPKLGIRLLCPRYNPTVITQEMKVIARWPAQVIEKIPKLTDEMFRAFLQLDYKRVTSTENPETGEVYFREVNPDSDSPADSHWEYRYPVDRLPVDRCLERIIAGNRESSQQLPNNDSLHHDVNQSESLYIPPPNPLQAAHGYGSHVNRMQQAQPYESPPSPLQVAHGYGPHSNRIQQPQHYVPNSLAAAPQYVYQPYDGMHQPQHYDSPNQLEAAPQYGPGPNGMQQPQQYDSPPNHQVYGNNQGSYTSPRGERIRGGGSSEDDNGLKRTYLSETPIENWNGLPVYVFVQSELEGDKMLVGFVKPREGVELVSEMDIDIEGHYLEDLGEFVDAQMLQAPSNEVFVVDMTANDDTNRHAVSVLRELYAQKKGPSKNWANGSNDTDLGSHDLDGGNEVASMETSNLKINRDGNSLENSPTSTQEQETADTSVSQQPTEQAPADKPSQNIAQDPYSKIPSQSSPPPPPVDKMKGRKNYLGKLPDGRDCFWIVNDPGAIYITTEELSDRKTTKICQHQYSCFLGTEPRLENHSHVQLMMRDAERYHCPWGCSLADGSNSNNIREALGFTSEEGLIDHCKDCFAYEDSSTLMIDVGRRSRCIRIPAGQKIRELYCDLSAALYARSSTFDFYSSPEDLPMKTSRSGARFSQSPTGKLLFLLIDDKLGSQIEHLETLGVQQFAVVYDLAKLLEAIFSLFEVNDTGNLRYNDEELLKYCSVEDTSPSPTSNVAENERLQDTKQSSSDSLCTNCLGCDLCVLPWEKTVPIEAKAPSGNNSNRSFGSGCCLINKLIRNSQMTKPLPGSLGEAKVLLLEIAEIVPDQLKFRGKHSDFDHLWEHRLWDQNNHDTWKRFVMGATCSKQLSQAYVTLVGSLDRSKLPSWWTTEGAGWSTTQVLLVQAKLSSLLLHVYVLDAAIADYMCQKLKKGPTSPSKDNVPQRPKAKVSGAPPERMKKYMEIAAKTLNWHKFDGDNGSDCCMCKDGGDLLCCDLCPKVQHAACCTPVIDDPTKLKHFVCQVCINDIEEELELVETS